jgi:hypothetical protein
MLRAVKASEVKSGVNYKVRRTSAGTFLEIAPSGGGGTSGGTDIACVQIQSVGQDHYSVKLWDLDTEAVTGDAFNVAKPTKLRGTITAETINAVAITYDYTGFTTSYMQREADDGTNSEKQVIVPYILTNDLLWVANVGVTGVVVSSVDVAWLDLNIDARAWARKYDQS